jgi:hypothetical protein
MNGAVRCCALDLPCIYQELPKFRQKSFLFPPSGIKACASYYVALGIGLRGEMPFSTAASGDGGAAKGADGAGRRVSPRHRVEGVGGGWRVFSTRCKSSPSSGFDLSRHRLASKAPKRVDCPAQGIVFSLSLFSFSPAVVENVSGIRGQREKEAEEEAKGEKVSGLVHRETFRSHGGGEGSTRLPARHMVALPPIFALKV